MSSWDRNSHGRVPSGDDGEPAEHPRTQRSTDQTEKADIRWIQGEWNQGERRLPENARIRRWMDLADKALQDEDSSTLAPGESPKAEE